MSYSKKDDAFDNNMGHNQKRKKKENYFDIQKYRY
jgi:hypothetical protein